MDSTIFELGRALQAREISALEAAEAAVTRCEQHRDLNSFITVSADQAIASARGLDELGSDDERRSRPLFGIPVALKDNIATKGIRTTAGSPLLRDWHPPRDATVVRRLRAAGATLLGKLNMTQFALRGPHPEYGDVHNPWDRSKGCAASSSGSGAAVAGGLGLAALGTDTAGSLRLPAAVCGLVGLKPTTGLISTSGIFPASALLDTVGPLTRTAIDARIMLRALAPATPQHGSVDSTANLADLTVALPVPQDDLYIDSEMATAFETAISTLEGAGARVIAVELPPVAYISGLTHILAGSEIADVHRHAVAAHGDLYTAEVRRQILTGAMVPATSYIQARRLRLLVGRSLDAILRSADVIAMPVIPMPAWDLGEGTQVTIGGREHDALAAMTLYCPLANVAGLPAVSVPSGFSASGLPLAFQFLGRRREDDRLLQIAAAYQALTDWHLRRPS